VLNASILSYVRRLNIAHLIQLTTHFLPPLVWNPLVPSTSQSNLLAI